MSQKPFQASNHFSLLPKQLKCFVVYVGFGLKRNTCHTEPGQQFLFLFDAAQNEFKSTAGMLVKRRGSQASSINPISWIPFALKMVAFSWHNRCS